MYRERQKGREKSSLSVYGKISDLGTYLNYE